MNDPICSVCGQREQERYMEDGCCWDCHHVREHPILGPWWLKLRDDGVWMDALGCAFVAVVVVILMLISYLVT